MMILVTILLALQTAVVISVKDGDTIDVEFNGKVVTVRMVGINAPELVNPKEWFCEEAKAFVEESLRGKTVILEPDGKEFKKDLYGRLRAYIRLEDEDETDFCALLIRRGYARAHNITPHPREAEYNELEQLARSEKLGIWANH